MTCTHTTLKNSKHCPRCFEPIAPLRNELALQRDCKLFFDMNFAGKALLVHHQNNSETAVGGSKSRALGVRAGVPDFELSTSMGRVLYIEIKFGAGRLSKEQREMIAFLKSMRFETVIARTLIEFLTICKTFIAKK